MRSAPSCLPALLPFCLSILVVPSLAEAQGDWNGRFRISANGGGQIAGGGVSQAFTVQKNLEPAPITFDFDASRTSWFDGGIVAQIRGRWAVGAAVSFSAHDADAGVKASIAHPFFFNQARLVGGTLAATRTELAVHLDAVYLLAARGRLELAVSGGASIFNATQTMITDVAYTDTYPFDTATFASAPAIGSTTTVGGFNVGADVTWKRWRRVGVGALLRFAHASAAFAASPNNTATSDVGGLQAGGGVRLAF